MSAPYQEGPDSTFGHNGVQYRLDPLFAATRRKLTRSIPIHKLDWVLEHVKLDPDRVDAADCLYPALAYFDDNLDSGRWVIVDGVHRLAKAVRTGRRFLNVKYVTQAELLKARIP